MLAYRHAFHAGNHADVLKHVTLACVLRHMNLKDKPYRLVDTHAGAGGYSLEGRFAQQKAEFTHGIELLWQHAADGTAPPLPPPLSDYLELVRRFNGGGGLTQYPGSPAIAQMLVRPKDELRLFELHPTDHKILAAFLGEETGVEVHRADGFDGLKSQLPPPSRRGVVLIDPSYEGTADYPRVVAALRSGVERFADGVYIVWYPQVTKLEAAQLPHRLQGLAGGTAPKGWLHARLTVQQPDAQGYGLSGSGVFVLNPPHTLHAALLEVLPVLVERLGRYDGANYLLEQKAA